MPNFVEFAKSVCRILSNLHFLACRILSNLHFCLPLDVLRRVVCRLAIRTELCKNLEVSRANCEGALTFFCAGKITRFLQLAVERFVKFCRICIVGLPNFVEFAFLIVVDVWRSVLCRLTIRTELCKNLEVRCRLRRRLDVLLRKQNCAFPTAGCRTVCRRFLPFRFWWFVGLCREKRMLFFDKFFKDSMSVIAICLSFLVFAKKPIVARFAYLQNYTRAREYFCYIFWLVETFSRNFCVFFQNFPTYFVFILS